MSTLPEELTSRQGFEALARDFPAGQSDPVRVVLQGEDAAAAAERLSAGIDDLDVFGVPSVTESEDGGAVLVSAPVNADPRGNDAMEAVRDLRATTVPDALADSPGTRRSSPGSRPSRPTTPT